MYFFAKDICENINKMEGQICHFYLWEMWVKNDCNKINFGQNIMFEKFPNIKLNIFFVYMF